MPSRDINITITVHNSFETTGFAVFNPQKKNILASKAVKNTRMSLNKSEKIQDSSTTQTYTCKEIKVKLKEKK